MSARIVADGSDAIVGVVWAVFVVLLVLLVALGLLALRRYNANRRVLRSEGLGPVSAAAQRLGEYAERPAGTHDAAPGDVEAPLADPGRVGSPADHSGDVERLREITELHDRGILDDAEFERQQARMLEP